MRRKTLQSRVLPLAAVLAALLALGSIAPSRALATCGDYVTMAEHGNPRPHHLPRPVVSYPGMPTRGLPTVRELPRLVSDEFVRHGTSRPLPCRQCPATPGQAPCQGPRCSGSHAPLSVPTTTIEHAQDHWACLWSFLRFVDHKQFNLTAFDDQVSRVHHVIPIYHPPRPI